MLRDKYIDETFGFLYQFGVHKNSEGVVTGVDVVTASNQSNLVTDLDPHEAEHLIKEYNRLNAALTWAAHRLSAQDQSILLSGEWVKTG